MDLGKLINLKCRGCSFCWLSFWDFPLGVDGNFMVVLLVAFLSFFIKFLGAF
jgi:hypothetical protein